MLSKGPLEPTLTENWSYGSVSVGTKALESVEFRLIEVKRVDGIVMPQTGLSTIRADKLWDLCKDHLVSRARALRWKLLAGAQKATFRESLVSARTTFLPSIKFIVTKMAHKRDWPKASSPDYIIRGDKLLDWCSKMPQWGVVVKGRGR